MNSMGMRGGTGGGFGGFSHKAPVLSTDMRCYFGCPEGFKKDYDLRLHLRVRHKDEDDTELKRAHQAAEEEIALTSSSASTFQCALCPRTFNNHKTFYDHIVKRTHKTPWLDYKDKFGSCEVASAPFECKICGRVIKYTRDSITCHLKKVHAINWPIYLERLRKMREGEKPGELPNIDFFECKICSASVKFISRAKHLKGVHKITESEYVELFADELGGKNTAKQETQMGNSKDETFDSGYGTQSQIPPNMGSTLSTSPIPQFQNPGYSRPPIPNYPPPVHEDPYEDSYDNSGMEQKYQPPQQPLGNNQNSNYFSRPVVQAPNPNFGTNNNTNLPKPPKSDIQDNTNKACSSCHVKFESRRMFIEHCTDVHKMKFRTASGTKISAATLNQRNSNAEMKRNYEENETIERDSYTNQNLDHQQQALGESKFNPNLEMQESNVKPDMDDDYDSTEI